MLDFGFYNMDCMEGMKQFPDKYFDLAIVDPPYGIGYDKQVETTGGTKYGVAVAPKKIYHTSGWDNQTPSGEYFSELFRVSKHQIIWGGTTSQNFCRRQRALFVGINVITALCGHSLIVSMHGWTMKWVLQECLDLSGMA